MNLLPFFKLMAEHKASDLFLSAQSPVIIKIGGNCRPVNNQVLNAEHVQQLVYQLMTPKQIADFERDLESNFAISVPGVGRYRINVFRARGAVAMVARYIRVDPPSLKELRIPEVLQELVMQKHGIILMVGATGSGKSSTMAAMLNYRNENHAGHILTLEDPVEFMHPHKKSLFNQREVGLDTKSYGEALKNAMREAPNVLMIGEIRDQETMLHAMQYAQAGHLCLSTLHANNSYHSMSRIVNFFPQDAREALLYDLSTSLKAIVSQRLVRTTDGRLVPAVEIMLNTPRIAELIRNGQLSEIKEAMEQSLTDGSVTFEQALFRLYSSGEIELDEALHNADSATNLSWMINNANAGGGEAPPARPKASESALAPKPEAAEDPNLNFNIDLH
ncbi:twitching motility protein PilU [Andreprevotia lacus DSM 23236]|jgi:twitching motility protein PilU|uniref:Twitching motility protein PilU n=1 Tax=Andreprevotia lacus DSM 23236 TaxID=1121001 RepID=A0A1W1X6D7_9NEIS|nr:PilT/PilU family type 4a pilus ATPase [Andreprevotia lacus]SMC19387.1 twitching motility protein PilU [Andreprevotia lacus DSM 23236]